eukprot:967819-Amphidinium_carterae.1
MLNQGLQTVHSSKTPSAARGAPNVTVLYAAALYATAYRKWRAPKNMDTLVSASPYHRETRQQIQTYQIRMLSRRNDYA